MLQTPCPFSRQPFLPQPRSTAAARWPPGNHRVEVASASDLSCSYSRFPSIPALACRSHCSCWSHSCLLCPVLPFLGNTHPRPAKPFTPWEALAPFCCLWAKPCLDLDSGLPNCTNTCLLSPRVDGLLGFVQGLNQLLKGTEK